MTSAYRPALAVSAGASLIGALVAIGIRGAKRTATEPVREEMYQEGRVLALQGS